MNLFVNELSFVAKNDRTLHTGRGLLDPLVKTVLSFRKLPRAEGIYTHSTFCTVALGNELTIFKCVLAGRRDEELSVFLRLITKGPFIDVLLEQQVATHNCTLAGDNVRCSCLAGAAYLTGDVVSATDTDRFSGDTITVNFSPNESAPVAVNLTNFIGEEALLEKYHRRYRPSAKHMAGGDGTLMPLDAVAAERVLNRGILAPNGRQVYGTHDEKCFEFQPEEAGVFHGYPVPGQQVPPETLRAMLDAEMISAVRYRALISGAE